MTPDPAPASAAQVPDARPGGATPPEQGAKRVPIPTILFVAAFGVLLGSFPARNIDLWKHLAGGRDLLRGASGPSPTWLYDVATYAMASAAGVAGLVGAKALLCGAVAVLMLRLSSGTGGWRVPLVVTSLAVLAMGSRLLLQPA